MTLTCCCCGDGAPAKQQWWNRDTDRLCRMMKAMETSPHGDMTQFAPRDVLRWWKRHKKEDAKRDASEKKRKRGRP